MDRKRFEITPGFAAFVCLLCCLAEGRLLLPFLLAGAAHECGHLLVLRLRIPVYGLTLCGTGAVLRTGITGRPREAWAIAAGPAVNLVLALTLFRVWPLFGLCNAVQLAWNLLPVSPLDGGRLALLLLSLLPGSTGRRLFRALQLGVLALALGAGIYGTCVRRMGLLPVIFAAFFLVRVSNLLDKPEDCWYNNM